MDKAGQKYDIEKKLLVSRNELLDIGLRNSLLNFRKSAKSLQIIEELSEETFVQLYRHGKAMTFGATPERKGQGKSIVNPSQEDGETVVDDLDVEAWAKIFATETDEDKSKRHTDNKLETGLPPVKLLSQLLKIETEARSYIEEQGVNVLYLALGFLHWYETDSSEDARKAPLILIPVDLVRGSGKESFSVRYSGDDLMDNLSLFAKLKTDFGLNLPSYVKEGDAEESDLPALADYFSKVSESVSIRKRWKVRPNDIALGFFSFGKFLMFNDLDPKNWPADKQPGAHRVMTRLLGSGFGDESPAMPADARLDDVIRPTDISFVKDADSSQTEAIWEARAGNNLVIQGPPGTGKSQTITNIIADLLGQNKSVLFVAEKMAALEVVKSRLDESHLGDAVLELHSQKSTKKMVLAELDRTLTQGRPRFSSGTEDLMALQSLRELLNDYSSAVNQPDPVSGLSFVEVVGNYLHLKREHPHVPQLPFAPMASWSQHTFADKRALVSELARHIDVMGAPKASPFFGSSRLHFSPIEQNQIAEKLAQGQRLFAQIAEAAGGLSERLLLSRPATLADINVICRAARRAAEAPRLTGLRLSTQDWQSRRETIRDLLGAGAAMAKARSDAADHFIDNAWEQDLLEVRQHYANYGGKWWRLCSGQFRGARARLQGLSKRAIPKDNNDVLALLDAVLSYQLRKKTYDQLESLGSALFGAQWNREQSDWGVLTHLASWVVQLHDDLGKGDIPAGLLEFLSGHSDASGLGETIGAIEAALGELQTLLAQASEELGFAAGTAGELQELPLDSCAGKLEGWSESLPAMYHITRFNQLSAELAEAELASVAVLASDLADSTTLLTCFDVSWYAGLVERSYARYPALQQFDRVRHEHQIERFRNLDLASLDYAQKHLAKTLWERMPNLNQPGEMATLRAELNKKRRHIPIRQLMSKAGRAIQQVKPVFMMSPMSIANFLPPGALEFDVAIFDEASQVKAVDAFGAILRCKQVIVVGDTKQMPPTNFFGRDVDIDDEESITADIESILSMFKYAGAQERYLRWHYRSRHESLIAVSNVEFYERKLMVFPSPGRDAHVTGLRFHHLPTALYDRGRTRTNKGEAQAVARAVLEHARTNPRKSLGVVAFSVAQRDLIQMEIELLSRQHSELNTFVAVREKEPFFVKNLENVQGDERDVIYISIGYGRNESGRIAREFGPLNRDGGHRRLNVLITRAKLGMEVFCNFRSSDLETDGSTSHGVRALKTFLQYAETGELEMPGETGKTPDSPFELEVISALRNKGYQIEPQVGSAGYFIDICVKDPDAPGRYLLAIECDGATYHSSRSARDRDRLRQGVLEGLNWRFHRIWSTDWFRNPGRELERVIEAIETARRPVVKAEQPAAARATAIVIERDAPAVAEQAVSSASYRKAVLPAQTGALHEAADGMLLDLIQKVLAVETPVHQDDIARRLMDAYSVKRMGGRIETRIAEALASGMSRKLLHRSGSFLYASEHRSATVRNRSEFSASEKKIELVPPEELDEALMEIIRIGFSMTPELAVSGALELLGFGRATAKIAGTVTARIDGLLASGRLKLDGARLALAEGDCGDRFAA